MVRQKSIHSVGLKCLLFILCVLSTALDAQDITKIDTLISMYYDYGQFTGAVLVAKNGQVIFQKGYGLANREWNIPNEPNTKFRIGSITKQFTAMLIMQLVEEGNIKLDDKLTDYLLD